MKIWYFIIVVKKFKQRINSDFVGKIVNIASRYTGFTNKTYKRTLFDDSIENDVYKVFIVIFDKIATVYESQN